MYRCCWKPRKCLFWGDVSGPSNVLFTWFSLREEKKELNHVKSIWMLLTNVWFSRNLERASSLWFKVIFHSTKKKVILRDLMWWQNKMLCNCVCCCNLWFKYEFDVFYVVQCKGMTTTKCQGHAWKRHSKGFEIQ